MKRKDVILIFVLFLLAFGLRFYDLSYPSFRWMDEKGHVPAAMNYWSGGQSDPDNWEHPPLRHVIMYGFLEIFGDNPYGWRMRNVLFGSVVVVLTYLFSLAVSDSRKTAVLGGLLLATDPLHIVLSRYTFDEIYGGAFFLAAVVLYARHDRRSSWFTLSALFMGFALATKWYFIPGWFLILLLALLEEENFRDIRTTVFIISTYLLIPLSVYVLSYYPWFGRGYTLSEFVDFTVNAYRALQSYRPDSYNPNLFFLSHTSPWEWFVRPVIVGQGTFISDDSGEFILYMNNLPIWVLTIPSLIGSAILAARKKSMKLALPVLLFCSSYALYLFISRPAFIYSAAPLLPFAFSAIAYGISQLADKYGARLYYIVLAVMLTWCLYLYPLVTAKKVPVGPYRFIINKADLKII